MRGDMMFSCSGNLATMACGLPYAVAAAVAYPQRQVIAFVGDGGLTMLMGELATLRKYDLNVKVIVIKNNALGQIKWEQMVFLGNPEYVCELQPIDFAAVGQGLRHSILRYRRPGEMCRNSARGAGRAWSGADRGGGRSARAADAAEDQGRVRPRNSPWRWRAARRLAARSRSRVASDKVRELI